MAYLEPGAFVDQAATSFATGRKSSRLPRCSTNSVSSSDLHRAGGAPGRDHLAQFQPGGVLRDALYVVRIVVLAVDEDDLLRPAGNVEPAAA